MTTGSSTRSSRGEQAKPELYGQKKEAKNKKMKEIKKDQCSTVLYRIRPL
jgi:hypothetical protein